MSIFGGSTKKKVEVFYTQEPEYRDAPWFVSNPFGSDYNYGDKSSAKKKARKIAKENNAVLEVCRKDGSVCEKRRYN